MMSAIELLNGAREYLTDPSHWTREAFARDDLGNAVGPDDNTACCRCLTGAVLAHAGVTITSQYLVNLAQPTFTTALVAANALLAAIDPVLYGKRELEAPAGFTTGFTTIGYLASWNDAPERTHTEIIEALDAAIEIAREWEMDQ